MKTFFIVIALILFGILIGVLTARFLPMPTSSEVVPTPTPSVSSSVVVEETPGFKNLEFPKEYLSLKYPQDWTLKTETLGMGSLYSLTSPNNFVLSFWTNADGLGGGCDPDCQKHNIKNSIIDTLNFYPTPLYIIVNGLSDNVLGKATIRFNVIPEKNCWHNICYGFNSKSAFGSIIITGTNPTYVSPEIFINSSDVVTAINVLKTLEYNPPKTTQYVCPVNGWVDCMPVLDAAKTTACSEEAMAWYKVNCPDFQGAAL